jgi:hypothetical protein
MHVCRCCLTLRLPGCHVAWCSFLSFKYRSDTRRNEATARRCAGSWTLVVECIDQQAVRGTRGSEQDIVWLLQNNKFLDHWSGAVSVCVCSRDIGNARNKVLADTLLCKIIIVMTWTNYMLSPSHVMVFSQPPHSPPHPPPHTRACAWCEASATCLRCIRETQFQIQPRPDYLTTYISLHQFEY